MATRVALVSCVNRASPNLPPVICTRHRYSSECEGTRNRVPMLGSFVREIRRLVPDELVAPYEKTLNKMVKAERLVWAERVRQQLLKVLLPGTKVIVLAGERYREGIVPFLKSDGFIR